MNAQLCAIHQAAVTDAHLRSNSDGAGVQMALAHHDATHSDERSGSEAEHLGTQSSSDGNIKTVTQATVCLKADTATKSCNRRR